MGSQGGGGSLATDVQGEGWRIRAFLGFGLCGFAVSWRLTPTATEKIVTPNSIRIQTWACSLAVACWSAASSPTAVLTGLAACIVTLPLLCRNVL